MPVTEPCCRGSDGDARWLAGWLEMMETREKMAFGESRRKERMAVVGGNEGGGNDGEMKGEKTRWGEKLRVREDGGVNGRRK